jgi:uncharacterized membrane protein
MNFAATFRNPTFHNPGFRNPLLGAALAFGVATAPASAGAVCIIRQ